MAPIEHQGGSHAGPSQPSPPDAPKEESPSSASPSPSWPNTNDSFRFYVDPYQTTKNTLMEMIQPSSFFTTSLQDATHYLLDPFLPVTPHIVDHLRQYNKPILSTEWLFACLTFRSTQDEERYELVGFKEQEEKHAEEIARLDGKKKSLMVGLLQHLESPSPDPPRGGEKTIVRGGKVQLLREFRLEDLPVPPPPPPSKGSATPTTTPVEVIGRRSTREKGKAREEPLPPQKEETKSKKVAKAESDSRTPSPSSSLLPASSVAREIKVLPAKRARNPPPPMRPVPPLKPYVPSAPSLSTMAITEAEGPPQGIPPGPRPTTKPSVTYASLIGQAILAHPERKLSLNAIYEWIVTAYPFFQRGQAGWMNSIRHNLSLNPNFVKRSRHGGEPIGKGLLWTIEPGAEGLFDGGKYRKAGSIPKQKGGLRGSKSDSPKLPLKGSRSSARHSTASTTTVADVEQRARSPVMGLDLDGGEDDEDEDALGEDDEDLRPGRRGGFESEEDDAMEREMLLEQEEEDAHRQRMFDSQQREPSTTFSSPVFADQKPLPILTGNGGNVDVNMGGGLVDASPEGSAEKRRRLE